MNEFGYPELGPDEDVTKYGETLTTMLEVRDKAKMKLLMEYEYNHLKTQILDNKETDDPIMKRLRWLNTQILTNQRHKPASTHYWVTISPKPQTPLESLKVKVEKYSRSKMIMGIVYTYELRPEDNTPHVHMIVKPLGVSHSDFVKRTRNPFKDIAIDRCVNIKICPEAFLHDKFEYIKGNKWDVSKEDACGLDKQWRLEHGLEPYYIIGEIMSDLVEEED